MIQALDNGIIPVDLRRGDTHIGTLHLLGCILRLQLHLLRRKRRAGSALVRLLRIEVGLLGIGIITGIIWCLLSVLLSTLLYGLLPCCLILVRKRTPRLLVCSTLSKNPWRWGLELSSRDVHWRRGLPHG